MFKPDGKTEVENSQFSDSKLEIFFINEKG